ncbi:MAG: hypothetical protein HRF50_09160 [Phycisphaerae bacterium]
MFNRAHLPLASDDGKQRLHQRVDGGPITGVTASSTALSLTANNADGDVLDAGEEVESDEDYSSSSITPAYGNNGDLTDDAFFECVYDGWNRLRKATRRMDALTQVAECRYDGRGRRPADYVVGPLGAVVDLAIQALQAWHRRAHPLELHGGRPFRRGGAPFRGRPKRAKWAARRLESGRV